MKRSREVKHRATAQLSADRGFSETPGIQQNSPPDLMDENFQLPLTLSLSLQITAPDHHEEPERNLEGISDVELSIAISEMNPNQLIVIIFFQY